MKNRAEIVPCFAALAATVILAGCVSTREADRPWNKRFDNRLARMGKGNWIVIADSAYSERNATGRETLVANRSLDSVLDYALGRVRGSDHVLVTAWISAEMEHVPDRDAPGVIALHREIRRLLSKGQIPAKVLPEQQILKEIEKDAATYNVLVLKSNTALPYSAVYLKLDCKYWDEAREKRLRDALRSME